MQLSLTVDESASLRMAHIADSDALQVARCAAGDDPLNQAAVVPAVGWAELHLHLVACRHKTAHNTQHFSIIGSIFSVEYQLKSAKSHPQHILGC